MHLQMQCIYMYVLWQKVVIKESGIVVCKKSTVLTQFWNKKKQPVKMRFAKSRGIILEIASNSTYKQNPVKIKRAKIEVSMYV